LDFGLFLLPLGRPPSLPFSRDVAALRLLLAAPMQAGQIISTLCIGHFMWNNNLTGRFLQSKPAYLLLRLPAGSLVGFGA